MAVYTLVSQAEAEKFLSAYALGAFVSLTPIAEGVENSNFLLVTEQGQHILTLFEKRVRAEDLPFFLGFTQHLAARGFPCPKPLPGKDGQTIRTLCGRPAVIVSFLNGAWTRAPETWHLAELGEKTARMHQAAEGFSLTRPNDLSLSGWQKLYEANGEKLDAIAPGLARIVADELKFLATHWPQHLPGSVIHADLFPDNVFFEGKHCTGFIDFYFACNDYLVYELAICLNAWCFDASHSFEKAKATAFFAAYQAARALSSQEKSAMPVLARGAALRFLLTRAHDWLRHDPSALVTPKDPKEYLAKLLFFQQVQSSAECGME